MTHQKFSSSWQMADSDFKSLHNLVQTGH